MLHFITFLQVAYKYVYINWSAVQLPISTD